MRSILSLGVLLIFIITFAGPIMAQETPIPEQVKKWEPLIGHWRIENELRNSPTDSWEKVSADWEWKWALDGHCFQLEGNNSLGTRFVEFFGFDPQLNTIISSGFNTIGERWSVNSSGWDETVINVNVTVIVPDGTRTIIRRAAWIYSSDFKSFTATAEEFTDGKWWINRKVKGTKVK